MHESGYFSLYSIFRMLAFMNSRLLLMYPSSSCFSHLRRSYSALNLISLLRMVAILSFLFYGPLKVEATQLLLRLWMWSSLSTLAFSLIFAIFYSASSCSFATLIFLFSLMIKLRILICRSLLLCAALVLLLSSCCFCGLRHLICISNSHRAVNFSS